MKLTEEMMWQATIANDPRFDGLFYYGLTTTGIFCRPSCKSRQPRRKHVRFFSGPAQAIGAGFRPCKRCRPDLPDHEPFRDLARQVAAILEREYANPDILAELARLAGVSPFHLQRSFKKQTGATPREYLQAVRIRRARELLGARQLDNTAICHAVGFKSLSAFYAAFRKAAGASPGQFRRNSGAPMNPQ